MSNFFDRVQHLLAGRPLFAWGTAIGLGNSSINRLKSGGELSQKTARHICAAERCSSEWLATGKGAPFEVNCTESAAQTYSAVEELLSMASEVLFMHDGSRVAIAVCTPVEKEKFHYNEWILISGPINPELMALLQSFESLRIAHMPPAEMTRLIAGQIGNWDLIGDVGGPRGARNPISVYSGAKQVGSAARFAALTHNAFVIGPSVSGVAEERATYAPSTLGQRVDALPQALRDAIEVLINALR